MATLIPTDAPPLYSSEGQPDPVVHAVYFHPGMGWTWYLLEYDPENDLAFGLVDGFFAEYGYFTLTELAGVGGVRLEVEPGPMSAVRAQFERAA